MAANLFVGLDDFSTVEKRSCGLFTFGHIKAGATILDLGFPTVSHQEVLKSLCPNNGAPGRHVLSYVVWGKHYGTNLTDSRNDDCVYVDLLETKSAAIYLNSASKARGNKHNVHFKSVGTRKNRKLLVVSSKEIHPSTELVDDYWDVKK
jgi:hypothetical protein